MSDFELKASPAAETVSVRKPRAKKAVVETAEVAAAPKVRKPRAKKEVSAVVAESKPTKPRKVAAKKSAKMQVTPEQRYEMVATAAYFIAEKRGFHHGYDHDDWLAAEIEVDAKIELI